MPKLTDRIYKQRRAWLRPSATAAVGINGILSKGYHAAPLLRCSLASAAPLVVSPASLFCSHFRPKLLGQLLPASTARNYPNHRHPNPLQTELLQKLHPSTQSGPVTCRGGSNHACVRGSLGGVSYYSASIR